MIIVPLGHKPDWRRPPIITILLVLINFLVFFGPQQNDDRAAQAALTYYAASTLPDLEFPHYTAYLSQTHGNDAASAFERLHTAGGGTVLAALQMQRDAVFVRRLDDESLIRHGDPAYPEWRTQRTAFNALWQRQVTLTQAFHTVSPTPWQFISHMFLHGSVGHLLGNMVLLALVGYIVEYLLGAWRYLLFYLLGGIGAVMLFWLTARSDTLLIGASGAVSAVMGMYAALFGRRRIEFFYWFLFYFDFAKAPAITLLLFWLANEFYQLWTLPYSNVAYFAHVGGLISGALLVAASGKRLGARTSARLAAEPPAQDTRAHAYAHAETLLRKLQFDQARAAWRALATRYPHDWRAVSQFHALARSQAHSDDYQQAAMLVFGLNGIDDDTLTLQAQCYTDYVRTAKRLRLDEAQLFRLAGRFAEHDRPADCERVLKALTRRGDDPRLAAVLFTLWKRSHRAGDTARAE